MVGPDNDDTLSTYEAYWGYYGYFNIPLNDNGGPGVNVTINLFSMKNTTGGASFKDMGGNDVASDVTYAHTPFSGLSYRTY
jgi:hypothetical protein